MSRPPSSAWHPSVPRLKTTKPVVLLITSQRWVSSARVAMSFAEAGWTVEVVCPRGHIFKSTQAVSHLHPSRFFAIPHYIRRAIAQVKPDLVVPCDDLVAHHLRHLCDADAPSSESNQLRELLTRSLGDPACYAEFDTRSRVAAVAQQQGVAVPETMVVHLEAGLDDWFERNGFPGVLKVDGTSGGYGVRIVSTLAEAKEAYAALSVPVSLPCAVKRLLVDRNETYLMPALRRVPPVVNIQRFIAGEEVTCTAACWQGEVLGWVALRVIRNSGQVGWSTVVQIIDDPNVLLAIKKICRRLRVSGLYGFDFIVERGTGRPHLLEINPRATPTTHLRTSGGSLAFSLRQALTGEGTKPEPLYKTDEKIALFPQEWHREPGSGFLQTARSDTPWTEPEFVRACLRKETPGIRAWFQPGGKLARIFSKVAGK